MNKSPSCHQMPVWESDIETDNSFDINYPDTDDYHEYFDYDDYEYKPKFWTEPSKRSDLNHFILS